MFSNVIAMSSRARMTRQQCLLPSLARCSRLQPYKGFKIQMASYSALASVQTFTTLLFNLI